MKTRTIIVVAVVLAALALPGALHAQETDIESVASAFYVAANAGDIDGCAEAFADDGYVDIGVLGTFTGKEEIWAWCERNVLQGAQATYEVVEVKGDTVTFRDSYTSDVFPSVLEATTTVTVKDGKITKLVYVPTDESMVVIEEFLADMAMQSAGSVFYDATNAGDIDGCAEAFADDGYVDIGVLGNFTGKEEIWAWCERNVLQGAQATYEVVEVKGDTVTFRDSYTSDVFPSVLEATTTVTIKDGKITKLVYVPTDETMVKIEEFLAAAAVLPETGEGRIPTSAVRLAVVGALAILSGLGVIVARCRSQQQKV